MDGPQVVRELKRDALGRVEVLRQGERLFVRRLAVGSSFPGTGLVARALRRREHRALLELRGLPGLPAVVEDARLERLAGPDGRAPSAGQSLVRTWVEGVGLHETETLPRDYFERLTELVEAMHGRGVCHNDLHKEQNILVLPDGYPGLVDFQLASVHRRRGRTWRVRCAEDLRHVLKHRRRYEIRGRGDRASKLAAGELPPRSLGARLWRRYAKPLYRSLSRRLGERPEPRRALEDAWPQRTAAVGPRDSGGPDAG